MVDDFLAKKLTAANLAPLFPVISAHVVATNMEVVGEVNVTSTSYPARVAMKGKRAPVGVTSSTTKALTTSGLVDAVTRNALDPRGKAATTAENGASSAGDEGRSVPQKHWAQREQSILARRRQNGEKQKRVVL